jgi:hypothetical protein
MENVMTYGRLAEKLPIEWNEFRLTYDRVCITIVWAFAVYLFL